MGVKMVKPSTFVLAIIDLLSFLSTKGNETNQRLHLLKLRQTFLQDPAGDPGGTQTSLSPVLTGDGQTSLSPGSFHGDE